LLENLDVATEGARSMRAFLAVLLVLVLAAPAAALPLPGPTTPPAAHLTLDRTAYRAQVDKAVQFALGYQKPDGGIYEYSFLLKDQDASLALKLLAAAETLDARGPNVTALVHYFETTQGAAGSFGSGSTVPTVTTQVIDGLLDAGYDKDSTVLTRALNYVRLTQGVDGSWSDGGAAASHQTAFDVEVLLRTGTARDDARIQQAIGFILSCQNGTNGGFAPTPGFFETEAASADVIYGLDAYLRAPATGHELHGQAEVQAAVDAARRRTIGSTTWAPTRRSWAPSRATSPRAASPSPSGSWTARRCSWTTSARTVGLPTTRARTSRSIGRSRPTRASTRSRARWAPRTRWACKRPSRRTARTRRPRRR
jgi:hypothetical protein